MATSISTNIPFSAPSRSSTVGSVEPGIELPTTSTIISKFTGQPILTGSCTQPNFALITASVGGGFLEYPWLGCSNIYPDCCPFDARIGGQLTVCPADYTTTGTGCCPSGYSLYSTILAGATPCYTVPVLPLVPPDATDNAAVSVINNQLFALQYSLVPRHYSSHLPSGTIAGIVIGLCMIIAGSVGAFLYLFRTHRTRRRIVQVDDAKTVANEGPSFLGPTGMTDKPLHSPFPLPSELSSPDDPMFPDTARWPIQHHAVGGALPAYPEEPPQPPKELEGDTYIHAHHPATNTETAEMDGQPDGEDEDMMCEDDEKSYQETFASECRQDRAD